MHSVRIELTKLILVGTRISYQATRDAGCTTEKKRLERQMRYPMVYIIRIRIIEQTSPAYITQQRVLTLLRVLTTQSFELTADVLISSCKENGRIEEDGSYSIKR